MPYVFCDKPCVFSHFHFYPFYPLYWTKSILFYPVQSTYWIKKELLRLCETVFDFCAFGFRGGYYLTRGIQVQIFLPCQQFTDE